MKYTRSAKREFCAGFSLLELMVTIAIVAILTAIAYPSYRNTIVANRITTETNSLVDALTSARTEAITRAHPITICPTANNTSCGGSWSSGWLMLSDYAKNGTTGDGAGSALRVWAPAPINAQDAISGSGTFINFDNQGKANIAVTFTITPASSPCGNGNTQGKTVTINANGRVATISGC